MPLIPRPIGCCSSILTIPTSWPMSALYRICLGQFERGIALVARAQGLNPLHPGWYHFSFTRYHYHRREYEESAARIRCVAMPNFFWPQILLTTALGQLGHPGSVPNL